MANINSQLVGGVLQPFTGILADLDVPTPQPQGLAPINGDLPGHAFVPPGPTDVRGLCPTLNTLANHNVCLLSAASITLKQCLNMASVLGS